jgi:nucleotide-binding universal stress UspA family protein
MIKKILIGIDESTYADRAAKYGFDLAETFGAQVGLVHIIEPVAMPMTTSGTDEILGTPMQNLNINDQELIKVQNEVSEKILARIATKYEGKAQITQFNEYGSTGEGIIACGKEYKADLIVLGTHHRSGLDRLLTGSVAEYVVRHSEIPVLVVPGKE